MHNSFPISTKIKWPIRLWAKKKKKVVLYFENENTHVIRVSVQKNFYFEGGEKTGKSRRNVAFCTSNPTEISGLKSGFPRCILCRFLFRPICVSTNTLFEPPGQIVVVVAVVETCTVHAPVWMRSARLRWRRTRATGRWTRAHRRWTAQCPASAHPSKTGKRRRGHRRNGGPRPAPVGPRTRSSPDPPPRSVPRIPRRPPIDDRTRPRSCHLKRKTLPWWAGPR